MDDLNDDDEQEPGSNTDRFITSEPIADQSAATNNNNDDDDDNHQHCATTTSVENISSNEYEEGYGNDNHNNNDDDSLVRLPRGSSRRNTQDMIQQGGAAAITAAEGNQDTDSVLSFDDDDDDDESDHGFDASSRRRNSTRSSRRESLHLTDDPLPPNMRNYRRLSTATYHFIQEASVESPLSSSALVLPPNDDNDDDNKDANQNKTADGDAEEGTEDHEDLVRLDDHVNVDEEDGLGESKQSWEDGVLVDTQSSESSTIHSVVENAQPPEQESFSSRTEMSCSERGFFSSDFQQQQQQDTAPFFEERRQPQHDPLMSDSSCATLTGDLILNDDLSVDSSPTSSLGPAPFVVAAPVAGVQEILLAAEIINDQDIKTLDQLRKDRPDDDNDTSLLYHIFSDFTTPSVTWETVRGILKLQHAGTFARQTAAPTTTTKEEHESAALPRDVVVNVVDKSKVLSILLCRNQQQLLQIPQTFFLAFFRILIRLLTNETDREYNESTLLTCNWKEEDVVLLGETTDPTFRLSNAASVIVEGPNATGNKSFVERSLRLTEDGGRDYNSRKDSHIYAMVRLQQCGTTAGTHTIDDSKYTARKLLRLFDVIKGRKAHRHLLAPVIRLLGLICTAGVSERVLRRMLTLASSPFDSSSQVPPVARLLLVRALRTATDGASRSIFFMGKASISHFFSFGGGKGLSRTISGLSAWPFRNDFGMAVWFRSETFEKGNSKYPVLLSVRAEDGGGIEISVMPLDENGSPDSPATSAAVLVVSIFDSDPGGMEEVEVQRLRVPGCVLLPRMWYHVAVRHTRSRMKGVFSLSTRQQVSIMLDGKVMLTEPLRFPRVSDEDFHSENKAKAFLQKAVRRSISRAGLSLTVALGASFQGQTGCLYLFHENVSDATLRAVYEVGAGTAGTVVAKTNDRHSGWDSRRGDIVRKSRLLDVGIKKDDAEEVVVSQRRQSTGDIVLDWVPASSGALAVMDLGEGEDPEMFELPGDLMKSAFSSKLFLVWDPSRTVANMALDLHIGAHVKMADGGVQAWQVDGAQDVIGSIGGVQALMPLFQSLICGDVEKTWRDVEGNESASRSPFNYDENGTFSKEGLWSMIPDLLSLIASFVQDHGENARELLRCGGIDVIENCILTSRKVALSSPCSDISSLFGPLAAFPKLSTILAESLLRLRSAGSHYIGLETKVFSRLLFNIPLWFSGVNNKLFVSLDATLLALLSTLAKVNPDKVRDCVGTKDSVFLIAEYVDYEETSDEHGQTTGNWRGPFTVVERRHASDILLGMLLETLATGTFVRDLSPFLNLLSYCLDSEWDESSQEMGEKSQIERTGPREERYRVAVKGCTILLLLLQLKPQVPNLLESFAQCCGSVEGAAGWILCAMVNSFDDTIRSLGMRCIVAFLEKTAKSPDAPLSCGTAPEPEDAPPAPAEGSSANRRIQSILAVGKGLMGPGVRSVVLPPSKLTARVTYKLMWHLLKGKRSRFGKQTYDALIYLAVDDAGTLFSSLPSRAFVMATFIIPDDVLPGGYRISIDYREPLSEVSSTVSGEALRNGLGIGTVMRLLRFLSSDMKDKLLADLLRLVQEDSSSVVTLSSLPDWQSCLFHLISETLERLNAGRANDNDSVAMSIDQFDSTGDQEAGRSSEIFEEIPTVERRVDLCLNLYATLLGHCVREGGDKALHSVEDTASLQRVVLNGQDVLCLILSRLVANLGERGTIVFDGRAQNTENEDLLKRSARLVTDAILSSGTEGLDMKSAARCWHSLRHLSAVTVSIVTKSGFGVAELFDYRNLKASAIDKVSGGLNGIRLPDTGMPAISAQEYRVFVEATGTAINEPESKEREIYRRMSVNLASQVLSLLDAFIFPDSLDASLPQSQIHGLDLVRNCEPRLAAQGPLIASAIRLSLLLVCHLEPCGMKLLQCLSRLRCLLHWALELIREATALEGYSAAFHKLTAPLDRLVLAIVLLCHRTLGRCSALLSEIEATSYEKYFKSKDSQKKYYRRLLRVSLELRDVVSAAFRGRNEVLKTALTVTAYDALRDSLETQAAPASKESLVRSFLLNGWVTGFQDVVSRGNYAVPEQVEGGAGVQTSSSTPTTQGVLAIRGLYDESGEILDDFEKALNSCFQKYLQAQKKWAETDLVRDLEYQGDETVKKLAGKHRTDLAEVSKAAVSRSLGANSRWQGIQRKVSDPWNNGSYWKLARHTDRLGQRVLLTRNRRFDDHEEASYELMLGKEREKEEKAREARLRQKEQLAEVMRRNAEAIVKYDANEFVGGDDDDDTAPVNDSDTESSVDLTEPCGDGDGADAFEERRDSGGSVPEEDWDKIEAEDVEDDAWAKAFIWSDFESVVARFESVTIVTLRCMVEGKLLLTSHGLYFRQVGEEISVMSQEPTGSPDGNRSAVSEGNDRRWRLSRLTEVLGRRYLLRAQALELFFSDSHELFLNFSGGTKERDRFYAKLRNSSNVPLLRSPKSLNPRTVFKRSRLKELWKRRKITNFQYIMELNKIAGRTFNDIMQYPVFPWILADYTSDTIDLKDSRVYRDLSKPMGALNPNRLAQLLERYNEFEDFGMPEEEKFLYGSHYSSPGVILYFMIRQEPFTSMAIELQSGRFDCPDRLFFDIAETWKSCLTLSSDVKELIPEFFTLPEMFLNTNNFPLGSTQGGRRLDNVGLPPWAKGSAYEFVRIHRMALESEFVSHNLNHWVDLIFGYKQRGPESEKAHNVFHYLSYEGAVDLDKIVNEVDRAAAESQIQNFGQTPSQVLVKEAHPSRCSIEEGWKPLIHDISVAKRLRCHTPSKQFATKKNAQGQRCAVTKIHIFSDSVAVVYSDLTVGTYKWSPTSRRGRLKPDKLRLLARAELSRSRSVIKRGTAVPQSSNLGIGNFSFAFTLGGTAKEELRQKAVMATSRLIAPKTDSLSTAEASGFLVSCGFWDNEVKVHGLGGYKLLCGDNGGHRGPVRCLAIGEDVGLLVTGGADGTCRIWVVDQPEMGVALSDGYVQTALGSTNHGDQLLSCCRVLWGHDSPISCVDLSSDLDLITSGSLGGLVCVHTLRLGEYVRSFRPPPMSNKLSGVSKVAVHKHGQLVVHMQDYGLHSYTVNGVRLCSKDAGEKLHDMSICSNGEILVTGGERCHVLIRSVNDLEILSMLDLSRHGPIRCIALTPEELNPAPQVIMIGSDDGYLTIVDEEPNYGTENAETLTF